MSSRLASRIPAWVLRARFGAIAACAGLVALTAVLAPLLGEDELIAVVMLFLLVVLIAAAVWGYAVGLLSAVLADVLLNVFFVPPLHKVTVQEPANVAALLLFLAVAIVGASMLALLRRQLVAAEERRAELAVMLDISRELAAAPNPERALDALARAIARALDAKRCDILRPDDRDNGWLDIASSGTPRALNRDQASLARLALDSGDVTRQLTRPSGPSTVVRPGSLQAAEVFLPFRSAGGEAGVIHLVAPSANPVGGDLESVLRAFADEAGVALHRARLSEQARKAEALQQSDEFKTVLLSSVSHDLRSPLTAIKASVGSLRTPGVAWSDDDRAQFLETIESQTDRLTTLVGDLLEMSRLEGGAVKPMLEDIEVRPLLDDAVRAVEPSMTGRSICLRSPERLWLRGDYALVLQALTNLLENAAKYSTPGGPITLSAAANGGRTMLRVADEGPGIAPGDLPHVFEKFYRGGHGSKVAGSGLGLSIVKAMVELSGGRVTVESKPGATTFSISLPQAGPAT